MATRVCIWPYPRRFSFLDRQNEPAVAVTPVFPFHQPLSCCAQQRLPCSRLPSQRKLWPLRLSRPLLPRARNESILLPYLRHPLRHPFPILIRRIAIFRVPLGVLLR